MPDINNNTKAILATYDLATVAEQQEGVSWYPAARGIARGLAERYGVSEAQAVGVIAALSPRNRWERNVLDAENLISAYVSGGPAQAMLVKVCTFTGNKRKAVAVLGLSVADAFEAVLAILSGPKLKEFASCIAGLPDVCIDGHAFCIWNGHRTGLADVPSIGVKLRRQIKADYVAAAEIRGLTPAAMQAVTWCAWRRIHGVSK